MMTECMIQKVKNFVCMDQETITPASLKFNLIISKVELMNYLIYFEGDIIFVRTQKEKPKPTQNSDAQSFKLSPKQ